MLLRLIVSTFTILLTASAFAQDNSSEKYRAMLDQYCVACHNQALKTAGLMLDKANVADVSDDPDVWERVITKLSLRAMPPVGMPRPPGDLLYGKFLSYLKTNLDRVAESSMNIGYKSAQRLNRSEYQNVVRDLLRLQINAADLLPGDNVGEGFDNNSDVLVFSPLLMESYVNAAAKVSRMAIGPASMEPASITYNVPDTFRQEDRASDELPIASRGGTIIQHHFPQDGEYIIDVKLHRNLEGYIRGLRQENTMDFRLDYKSIGTIKVGGEVHGASGPIFTDKQTAEYGGQPEQVGYEFTADNKLKMRLNTKSGMHSVGVTFVDEYTKPTGILMPEFSLAEMTQYKGGVPLVASVTITGPFNAMGPGLTASQDKIFSCRPSSKKQHEPCARVILSNLARQAFRRPVNDHEVEELITIYRTGYEDGRFESGIELALQGILSSPDFLIRIETEPEDLAGDEIYPLNDIDLASRLSFFLWSSIPDEELLALAEKNELHKPAVLRQQLRRMMTDPRFSAFINNFGSQWLSVRKLNNAAPNIYVFNEYDGELKKAFAQEILLWLESMVRKDQSILELMTSNYTYVNGRLARHYGISGISPDSPFIRVSLDDYGYRRGLFGKGGILTATSYNNRTSPVQRGKWVLENLLSMPPPPPPDNVTPTLETNESGRILTLKQAMEKHRANPVCATCHKLMDPIGFALENFDAIGAYRTHYIDSHAKVDVSGTLFDGSEAETVDEFMDNLLKYSDRIVHTAAEKVLTYALGRELNVYDQYVLRRITEKSTADNYSWSSLLLAVIESTPFQYRRLTRHDDL